MRDWLQDLSNDSWFKALIHELYEKWEIGFEILVDKGLFLCSYSGWSWCRSTRWKIGNDSWLEALTRELYKKWEIGFEILLNKGSFLHSYSGRSWCRSTRWKLGMTPVLRRWPANSTRSERSASRSWKGLLTWGVDPRSLWKVHEVLVKDDPCDHEVLEDESPGAGVEVPEHNPITVGYQDKPGKLTSFRWWCQSYSRAHNQHEVLQMNQEGLVISQGGWVGFVVG
jgi:hypothetical protein